MKTKQKLLLKRTLLMSSLVLFCLSNKTDEKATNDFDNAYSNITTTDFDIEKLESIENLQASETTENIITKEIEEDIIPENEHVDLLMIGDMLIHQPVYKSGIQNDGTLNYDHFFTNIQSDLDEAEIAIVNQETILGGSELGFSSYPCFNSPQEIGDAEAKAGFDVILHATNHTMDKGFVAIDNTINFWKNTYPEITVLGINSSPEDQENIQIYEQNGFKIALLNYTYGTNGIPLPSDKPYLVNLLNEETFAKRFNTYMSETSPLIEYYKDKLFEVDSSKDKYEIFKEIERIIGVSNDNN